MREILFRGKGNPNFNSGEWYEGLIGIDSENDYYISGKWWSRTVIAETVGQYTGLQDKNGKRIFEGDVVKGEHVLHENMTVFEVVYDETAFCFRDKEGMCWHPDYTEDTEIIGNIHDNPELLKGE